jgi:subtilisin family serine protease
MPARSFLRGTTTALLVLTAVVAPQAASAAPGARVAWEERSWTRSVPAGSTGTETMVFTGTSVERVAAPNVRITGPVADVLSADAADISWLGGNRYELSLDVDLPAGVRRALTGSLALRDGTANIGPAVPLRVVPVALPAGAIPEGTVEPSADRIGQTADGQLVVVDEIVVAVGFDAPDPDAVARAAAAAVGGRIIGSVPALRLYQVRIPGAVVGDLAGLAAQAEGVDGVEFASLDYVDRQVDAETIPDDPEWDGWDVDSPGGNNWGLEAIDAPDAWDTTTGSSSVRVAVIDFDMDGDHGDLDGNVSRKERGDSAGGHGSHVGGTICAEGDNDHGVTGVAWDCDLRFFAGGDTVARTAERMADAVDDGARVVNMSLNDIENGNCAADPAAIEAAAADANDVFGRAVIYAQRQEREVLWAVAAGNECHRDAELTAPGGLGARFPQTVMTVAAVGQDGRLAGFSNTGESVSVAAPGVDIFSTLPRTGCWFGRFFCDDAYGTKSGTSMATPHVAGLAALVIADDPSRTAAEVKSCIVAGAQRAGAAVPGAGFHVIDAPAAVACAGVIDLPEKVDVVLALDLTGSMGGVLSQAKAEVTQMIADIGAAAPGTDFRFGIVSYEDYPAYLDSTACGSSYASWYGSDSDRPFRVNSSLSGDASAAQGAVNGLQLGDGWDGPESYGRMIWELAQADTGATLGWRPDALRLVINFGDNVPHDVNINEGVDGGTVGSDTGIDPGRNGVIDCGGDDIDFQDDALAQLHDSGARLLHVDSSFGSETEPYWRYWTSLTGGAYTRLGDDRSLSEVTIELLGLL